MEKEDILAFQALAKYGSFTKASEALYIAQPTLSKKVATLESELGLTLVERTKRYARLTYAGIVFLEESKALLAQEEKMVRAVREAAREGARSLRVGIMGMGLAEKSLPFIRAFKAKHPEVSLHLDLLDLEQIRNGLEMKRLDCAITDELGLSFLEPLKTEEIGESWSALVFPADHPFARKKRKTFRSLETEPFLVLQGKSSAKGLAPRWKRFFSRSGRARASPSCLPSIARLKGTWPVSLSKRNQSPSPRFWRGMEKIQIPPCSYGKRSSMGIWKEKWNEIVISSPFAEKSNPWK